MKRIISLTFLLSAAICLVTSDLSAQTKTGTTTEKSIRKTEKGKSKRNSKKVNAEKVNSENNSNRNTTTESKPTPGRTAQTDNQSSVKFEEIVKQIEQQAQPVVQNVNNGQVNWTQQYVEAT